MTVSVQTNRRYRTSRKLIGETWQIERGDADYPKIFNNLDKPPAHLYGIGDESALVEGLAIIGARKATPYGLSCARRFGKIAAEMGIVVISGGALGCDSASQKACVESGGRSVAFLGGGYENYYPKSNFQLFQKIIDTGGALVSENPPDYEPLAYTHRLRNRLIAALAKATLIVEAGIPSGTFSTADEALAVNREVLCVPGSITSDLSRGCNRLIYQGATPIVDTECFCDCMKAIFGDTLSVVNGSSIATCLDGEQADDKILRALRASRLSLDELLVLAKDVCGKEEPLAWLMIWIADKKSKNLVAQYPDGRYGPCLRC